jgi:hypothetical protein
MPVPVPAPASTFISSSACQPPDSRSLLAQALASTTTADADFCSLVEGLQGKADGDWSELLEAEEQQDEQQQQQQSYHDAGVAAGLGERLPSQPALKRTSPIPNDLAEFGSLASKLQENAPLGIHGMLAVCNTVCLPSTGCVVARYACCGHYSLLAVGTTVCLQHI